MEGGVFCQHSAHHPSSTMYLFLLYFMTTMHDTATAGTHNQAAGQWEQFKGAAQSTYGDLTDDWSDQFNGNVKQAMGWLQEKYGDAQERLAEYWDDTEA